MKISLFRAIAKRYLSILIAILLVASLGCGIMSGMANGIFSLETTLNEYLENMNCPDASVETEVMKRDVVEKILAVPGVEAVDARLVGNTVLIGGDGSFYTMQTMTYSEDEFQGIYYWEKSEEKAEYPVLVEYRFSRLNGIHAGDQVEIRVDDRSWNAYVKGIVSRPEMIAVHRIGGMEINSTDIGYVYIPIDLLDKVDNPDYDAASSEWEEKNQEFKEQEKDAKEEYQGILENIDDAEKLLKEKQAELDDKIKSAGSKKKELLKYKEEIDKRFKELEEKEKELSEKRAQLDAGHEELQKAEGELNAAREELGKKKAELDSTKKTLETSRNELVKQLDELNAKEKELSDNKESLQRAGEEISNKLKELDENEKTLNEKKVQLQETVAPLNDAKEVLVNIKKIADELEAFVETAEKTLDSYEWAETATDQLDMMISDADQTVQKLENIRDELASIDEEIARAKAEGRDVSELEKKRGETVTILESMGIQEGNLDYAISGFRTLSQMMQISRNELTRVIDEGADPEKIEEIRKRLIEDCKSALEFYKSTYNVSDDAFNQILSQIEGKIKEVNDGLAQIEDALVQIAEGRKVLLENKKGVEDALGQLAELERQLQEGKTAITDGIRQIDEGLAAVKTGYSEYEKYAKQLKDSEEQLNSKKAELSEYERQWSEAERVLKDAREALLKSLKEIEDALKQIDEGIAEGRKKLESSQEEIKRNRNEVNEKWIDVLRQFSDAKSELKKAREELDEWNGYGEFCNEFLLKIAEDADHEAVLSEVEKTIGENSVKSSSTYERSAVKRIIDANLEPLGIMSLFVPMLFFVVALIVECLFMSFMVRQCRREIGILRALGFSGFKVVMLFCTVNLFVSAGAILLGLAIGYGITRYTGYFFQSYFNLYYLNYVINWRRFLLSGFLTVFVGQMATIISSGYISRIRPSEAMSRPAPTVAFSDEKGLFSNIHVPPFFKYCVFSLLRNKLRLVFSLICLSSSVVLIFAAVSFDFSKNKILSQWFEDRTNYDCEIFLVSEPDGDFMKRLGEIGLVENPEVIYYYTRLLENDGISKEKIIKGIPADSELIRVFDSKGERIFVPDEGMILEKHTADILNVHAGDTVFADGNPMKITELCEECENRFQYVSSGLKDEMGAPEMCSVICNVKSGNEKALMEFLSKEEIYIYAAFTDRVYDGIRAGFDAFGICASIIIAFSVAIGLLVVINTIRTNLQEQKKDLCVLRTLGFQYSSLSVRLFSQSMVYFVFSGILGIPTGIAVTKMALDRLEIETRNYPFVNDYRLYLFTLLLVFAYIVLSHFMSMRTIKDWDMVETVKDKE